MRLSDRLGYRLSIALRRAWVEDDLGKTVAVTQVDEYQAAVVTAPVDPPLEQDALAGVGVAQRAAGMCSDQGNPRYAAMRWCRATHLSASWSSSSVGR